MELARELHGHIRCRLLYQALEVLEEFLGAIIHGIFTRFCRYFLATSLNDRHRSGDFFGEGGGLALISCVRVPLRIYCIISQYLVIQIGIRVPWKGDDKQKKGCQTRTVRHCDPNGCHFFSPSPAMYATCAIQVQRLVDWAGWASWTATVCRLQMHLNLPCHFPCPVGLPNDQVL
jgi:hypothetical protein